MIFHRGAEVYSPEKFIHINTKDNIGRVFRIWKIFYLYKTKGIFWFSFFGKWGVHGKNLKVHEPLFSERNKLIKRLKIGSWIFKTLK